MSSFHASRDRVRLVGGQPVVRVTARRHADARDYAGSVEIELADGTIVIVSAQQVETFDIRGHGAANVLSVEMDVRAQR